MCCLISPQAGGTSDAAWELSRVTDDEECGVDTDEIENHLAAFRDSSLNLNATE